MEILKSAVLNVVSDKNVCVGIAVASLLEICHVFVQGGQERATL